MGKASFKGLGSPKYSTVLDVHTITRSTLQEILEQCLESSQVLSPTGLKDDQRTEVFKEEIRRFGSVAEHVAFGTWAATTETLKCHCPVGSIAEWVDDAEAFHAHPGISTNSIMSFITQFDDRMANRLNEACGIAQVTD